MNRKPRADFVAPIFYETSGDVLDALKAKLNARSDAEVARALGVNRASASNWRIGRGAMSPETAKKAAEILELDAGPIVIARWIEGEKNQEMRSLYQKIAQHFYRSGPTKLSAILATTAAGALMAYALISSGNSDVLAALPLALSIPYAN